MSEHGKLGALIIESLEEAIRHARGEDTGARVHRFERREDGSIERVELRGDKEISREAWLPRMGELSRSYRWRRVGTMRLL